MHRKHKFTFSALSIVGMAAVLALLPGKGAQALLGSNTLDSTSSAGVKGNGGSTNPDVSYDGRYVVFVSSANNLVAGDTNGFIDVFLKDNTTGTTTRVSVDSAGNQSNANSQAPRISSNGKYVVYSSDATNLVAGDTNGSTDIFRYTIATGAVDLVSKDAGGTIGDNSSSLPDLDSEGRFVTFESRATNLVAGDTNATSDVFVKDMNTGTVTLVSQSDAGTIGNGISSGAKISCDGRYVAFSSTANNLIAADTNGVKDVFLSDLLGGHTVSDVTAAGNGSSTADDISCDGKYVLFDSLATNIIGGDTNGVVDAFRYDRTTGNSVRVSIRENGSQPTQSSVGVSISADGKYGIFRASGSTFVTTSTDTNGANDLFMRDLSASTFKIVSQTSTGSTGNGASNNAVFSGGNRIVFDSGASDLVVGDTNGAFDVFMADVGPAGTCIF